MAPAWSATPGWRRETSLATATNDAQQFVRCSALSLIGEGQRSSRVAGGTDVDAVPPEPRPLATVVGVVGPPQYAGRRRGGTRRTSPPPARPSLREKGWPEGHFGGDVGVLRAQVEDEGQQPRHGLGPAHSDCRDPFALR